MALSSTNDTKNGNDEDIVVVSAGIGFTRILQPLL